MNKIKLFLSEQLTSKITRNKQAEFLKQHKSDSRDVLDIGASKRPYENLFPNAITMDIDSTKEVNILADAQSMPFKDSSFSIIICTCVLEHIPKPWLAISEMKRVIKKNGKAIVTVPFIFPIHDSPGDYFRFTRFGLMELFSDWKIVLLKEDGDGIESLAALLQRMGFQSITRPEILRYTFFVIALILSRLNFLWTGSFGDIGRSKKVNAFASNYYLVCQKK